MAEDTDGVLETLVAEVRAAKLLFPERSIEVPTPGRGARLGLMRGRFDCAAKRLGIRESDLSSR